MNYDTIFNMKELMDDNYLVINWKGGLYYILVHDSFSEKDVQDRIAWISECFKRVPANIEDVTWVWSLVGNIIEEHPWGEKGEIKNGTRHFPPGAKVYCFPSMWGDGYLNIQVIGKPRKTNKLITIVIPSKLVTNWRIQKVHDTYVISEMLKGYGWDNSEQSKTRILEMLEFLLKRGRTDNLSDAGT